MPLSLKLLVGRRTGELIALDSTPLKIGRASECNLRSNSQQVSRRHCDVLLVGGRVSVRDLSSRTGTWINGFRLPPARELLALPGDRLQIGPFAFEIVADDRVVPLTDSPTAGESGATIAEEDVARWLTAGEEENALPEIGRASSETSSIAKEDAFLRPDASPSETTPSEAAQAALRKQYWRLP